MKNCLFLPWHWTTESTTCLTLSWPALPHLQDQLLDETNCYLMEVCTESLQRISRSSLASSEEQVLRKLVVWWPPCRRSPPSQGPTRGMGEGAKAEACVETPSLFGQPGDEPQTILLNRNHVREVEPVDQCLARSPGKEPDALVAAVSESNSQLEQRKDRPEILPPLCGLIWLFAKQQKSNPQCIEYLPMCTRRDLSLQHLSLQVCKSPAMLMHCFYHWQFPFGPIWKTFWVIQGQIFLLSVSNAAFWQEKMSKVTWKRKVQLRDVSIIS